MANVATYDELTSPLRLVFDNDSLVATPTLSAREVQGWDSLTNVRLFNEVEQAFGVRFNATEIGSLKNVGQLADLIEKETGRS